MLQQQFITVVVVQEPERASEGLGGTYFFKDEAGQKVAIVKPCDEEPLAPNNPKVCTSTQTPSPHPLLSAGFLDFRSCSIYAACNLFSRLTCLEL